jgi:hypothetical protein
VLCQRLAYYNMQWYAGSPHLIEELDHGDYLLAAGWSTKDPMDD